VAPGCPLTSVVTAIKGPVRTWAQLALHISVGCHTLDRVEKAIREFEEWCNQNCYGNAGSEIDYGVSE